MAQVLGAIVASSLLLIIFGPVANLGATLPLNNNWQQSFILEIILTFVLMLVILGSAVDQRSHSGFAGLAIGLTVGLEAACMGPITGASMNPAQIVWACSPQWSLATPMAVLDCTYHRRTGSHVGLPIALSELILEQCSEQCKFRTIC